MFTEKVMVDQTLLTAKTGGSGGFQRELGSGMDGKGYLLGMWDECGFKNNSTLCEQ